LFIKIGRRRKTNLERIKKRKEKKKKKKEREN
jgi:hypothetical protein